MAGLQIRASTPDDIPDLLPIEQDRYGRDAWSADQMRAEILDPEHNRWYATAEIDGVVVGYAGIFLSPPDADIQTVTAAAGRDGQGIGRALLSGVIDAARRRGCNRVFLEVRADNEAALALYRGAGFTRLGIRRRYYADGGDAVNMRLSLKRTALQEVIG